MTVPSLVLTQDAVAPIRRGHPWVYRDGVRGSAEVGSVVQLVDSTQAPVAWGLFDEGNITVRVLGPGEAGDLQGYVARAVGAADAFRTRGLGPETTGYRVVNAAGDGLPGVVVDRYDDLAVLRIYSRAWESHLSLMVEALASLPWVGSVFRRFGVDRVDGRDGGETLHGPAPKEVLTFQEAGLTFLVRPFVGQKTGFFLDHRENRCRLGALSPGRMVLNLFCYTGGFSVHAAANGAARVTSVDVSGPALEDAKENFRLNGLDPDRHVFLKEDVFSWEPRDRFDLVICDPPNLARKKASDRGARGAYRDLARRSGGAASPGGLLAMASCTARLSRERWEMAVADGLASHGSWSWLEHAAAPLDHPVAMGHPEGRYLKFALLRRGHKTA